MFSHIDIKYLLDNILERYSNPAVRKCKQQFILKLQVDFKRICDMGNKQILITSPGFLTFNLEIESWVNQ